MRQKSKYLGLLIVLFMFLVGCGSQGEVEFSDIWARPGLKDGNSAVFFVVHNLTDTEDKILSASSDVAAAVELHKSSMVDDVMKMEKQESVHLPAGEAVLFKPGGLHVMLIGLNEDLKVGDDFTLKLVLEGAGEMVLDVVVREP